MRIYANDTQPRWSIIAGLVSIAVLIGLFFSSKLQTRLSAKLDPCNEAPQSGTVELTVRGAKRTFQVLTPASAARGDKLPVLFFFHAAGGKAADIKTYGAYTSELRETAVFVAPTGQKIYGGFGWDEACHGADVEFFDAMLAVLPTVACVDTSRVGAYGFSWGGDFANALGCCRGASLRAVSSLSGAEMGTRDGYATDTAICAADTPAYQLVHGEKDSAYKPEQFSDIVKIYSGLLGCKGESVSASPPECKTDLSCRKTLQYCSVSGVDHTVTARMTTLSSQFLSSTLRTAQ